MVNFETLSQLYASSVAAYGDNMMNMTADRSFSRTYREFGSVVDELSQKLLAQGVGYGSKVAILSAGHPNWSAAFFASVAFGRVAVPILPDFSANEVNNVLSHSETKVLFVSKRCLAKVSEEARAGLAAIYDIETLELIYENSQSVAEAGTAVACEPSADDLAVLIYTSGTTGTAKGVMLTHRNIVANVDAAYDVFSIDKNTLMLSMLPLAHAYELSLGMIYPFSAGAGVCYLTKAPVPSYLMKVFQDIRPTAMLIVPLIIEKIYNGVVMPKIRKSKVLTWMNQHCNSIMCRLVGREVMKAFGGRMEFIGIGGAKPDVYVERFLKKAHIPYRIGYGLTECAPLLSFSCWETTVPGSIGWPVKGVELRLDNVNPETGEGEIVARGANIMPGYYKDPERTAKAFTADGWFRTNDLAAMDAKGRFYIKGRLNNMILSASGENIYPEEIENVIKQIPEVEDAIVVNWGGKLVALVKTVDNIIDFGHISEAQTKEKIEELRETMRTYINQRVKSSSQIGMLQFMTEPFDKTATLKIRRFLYAETAPAI